MNEFMQSEEFFTPQTILSFAVASFAVYTVTLAIQSVFKIKNALIIAFITAMVLSCIIMLNLYGFTLTTLYMAPLNGCLMYTSILGAVQTLHKENPTKGKSGNQPMRKKTYRAKQKGKQQDQKNTRKIDIFTKWY